MGGQRKRRGLRADGGQERQMKGRSGEARHCTSEVTEEEAVCHQLGTHWLGLCWGHKSNSAQLGEDKETFSEREMPGRAADEEVDRIKSLEEEAKRSETPQMLRPRLKRSQNPKLVTREPTAQRYDQ